MTANPSPADVREALALLRDHFAFLSRMADGQYRAERGSGTRPSAKTTLAAIRSEALSGRDHADVIIAALPSLGFVQAPAGWRAIESAPRDGTHVLVCGPAWGGMKPEEPTYTAIARFGDSGFIDVVDSAVLHPPTHWQPLPPPPAQEADHGR